MSINCQRQPKGWRTSNNDVLVASVVEQKVKRGLETVGDAGVGCIKGLLIMGKESTHSSVSME
jgi:hypothetical protein